MKIELSQSGGYAGETIKLKEISTDDIPEPAKAALNALLKETDFFNTKKPDAAKEEGADMLTYHLKISKSKKQSHAVSFGESARNKSYLKLVTLVKSL